MSLEKINDMPALQKGLENSGKVLLMKNSTTCPISHNAFSEYQKFAQDQEAVLYYLNVQEARPLSNEIAEMYGVKHESPQVLLFEQGHVTWTTSHWSITYGALQEQFNK
ncbi:hypothetical protein A374_09623 [Fictibacillus macauensis ZFHKF-1]|uniref:General stress protein n=1 Tax=Fictibacillus macauensis ZFHKF-1 TaxID=1196324 RepID=I8J191_9BACL|nr:bacillithiol system redox-active protein YtxJ [Fictibacillus macauensis]EIT85486.1 hypothetical protein A374_09623 [Fictibacillus macauensis ZFHKF-1]